MFARLKKQWAEFKRSRPGSRFRDRYERRKRSPTTWWVRLIEIGLAIVMVLLGIFFAVAPGPASVFFFLAGGLLASESKTVARLMDWIEMKSRAIGAWARRHWRRLSRAAKGAVIAIVAACSAACGVAAYLVVFN